MHTSTRIIYGTAFEHYEIYPTIDMDMAAIREMSWQPCLEAESLTKLLKCSDRDYDDLLLMSMNGEPEINAALQSLRSYLEQVADDNMKMCILKDLYCG